MEGKELTLQALYALPLPTELEIYIALTQWAGTAESLPIGNPLA
jgi:hypothetical protein